ncbi:unnamed protein product [Cuscuta campestris]|uniref:Uncharacterized protein n=1 Tax=Cuscuta campestris TaxID=132261 RepID=A0A484LGG1_9ASTE|nr:unnamed protein product [Cuscuta campestris]
MAIHSSAQFDVLGAGLSKNRRSTFLSYCSSATLEGSIHLGPSSFEGQFLGDYGRLGMLFQHLKLFFQTS